MNSACTTCKKRSPSEGYKRCDECRRSNREAMARYRERNPFAKREFARRRRENVLAHYGGVCACCGEGRYEFLALDHIEGGGTQHRETTGMRGANMIGWAIRAGLPPIFQVLCHNCNQATGYYGYCPHERALRVVGGDE